MNAHIKVKNDVQASLDEGRAVVALESTIVTHGMPYPDNIETAIAVQSAIRAAGATPATIAVMNGLLRVGLDDSDIDFLAQQENVMKLSRADLAMSLATKSFGSTTVAATMIGARLAGINVFATGGIGGVHRGADKSFDISADLIELGQTDVTVVCAGAKAILDIPKTLEVLETHGVPVVTYGQSRLPAFWSRDSGIDSPLSVQNLDELVAFLRARRALELSGGLLLANPVPIDMEIPRTEIDEIITQAIRESENAGITGKQVTPWLLQRMEELTDGRSLETNKALIINNATLAAELAVKLSKDHN